MPQKKRKLSEEKMDEEPTTSSAIKKRKRTELEDAELMQELYETVRNHKTDEGRVLCEAFIRAPKRRADPEYYNLVSNPIDLLKVHSKLKSDEYKSLASFTEDIDTLVDNAKLYYRPDTQEYQDACDLMELFLESKTVLLGEELAECGAEDGDEEEEEEEEEAFVAEEVDQQAGNTNSPKPEVTTDTCSEVNSIVIPGSGGTPTIKLKMAGSPSIEDNRGEQILAKPAPTEAPVDDQERAKNEDETAAMRQSEPVRSLRERRYTYRDFLFPKVVISEKQLDEAAMRESSADKDADQEEDKSSVTGDDDDTSYEELFGVVVTAKDGDRCVSDMFKVLPSRKKYPDYYDVIHDPIDLKTIAQRIQGNEYKCLDDMVKDLNQMVNNAKNFNETGSQIYRDALTLKKVVLNKKNELDLQRNSQPPVRSKRIRHRKAYAGQRLSLVIAALDSDSDKEDMVAPPITVPQPDYEDMDSGGEESTNETEEDPLWLLYRAVKGQRNSLGLRISEPFLKLPSKRVYPDYYEEIKRPMSLLKIQKKLKSGVYRDLDQLVADMDLVFINAKRYNMDESKLYKDAVKLQGIMKAKLKEIKEELWEHGSEITKSTKARRSLDAGSTTSGTSEEGGGKKKGRRSLTSEEAIRKRLWILYKTVLDYQFDGRPLINIFLTVPSRKDYPDYYLVISEPIDMSIIENKLQLNKYQHEKALIADFELMFNNARHYNEEHSQVYRDAEKLERIMMSKVRSMPAIDGVPKTPGRNKPKTKSSTTLSAKLQDLYNTIRDYNDSRKRVLSTPFMKLPLKNEYPDYYDVIKRPMDMQRVFQRMMSNQYNSIEDMVSDMVLMFDNACKYNEPDSLIYKDSLTLQRVCLEKKAELCADEECVDVPDVRAQVQELMTNLFISTFNHMDEEGRCYSDSFMELPSKIPVDDADDEDVKEKLSPTFEQVKRNLDKGRYRRADRFQEDMFEVFEFARRVSRTDSQVYEDSIELQMFFIRIRDELCKNGEHLLTPALSFRETHLLRELELEKEEKMTREQREDEDKKRLQGGAEEEKMEIQEEHQAGKTDSVTFGGQNYGAGDYVYIQPRDNGIDPHIVCIERMWKEDNGEPWLYGCWFLRPNETYHLATRKFIEKELFRSDFFDSVPFTKVLGRCHVLFVKDYFKMKPEGMPDKDVYVCESRYSGRTKAFKKCKSSGWQQTPSGNINIVSREVPLIPVRVTSVFAEKAGSIDRSLDDGLMDVLDKDRDVVVLDISPVTGGEEGCVYYEQYQSHTAWVKVGDHVFVRSDGEERPIIIGIERIWSDASGDMYIFGYQFVHPAEVEHPPTRLFYKREVFRCTEMLTTHVANIMGRCAVMTYKEYTTCRLIEITETDVYICESKYMQNDRVIKKFGKPIKKPPLSLKVCDDEVIFFRKPIIPHKEQSPLLMKASEESFLPDVDTNTMDSSYSENMSLLGDVSMSEAATPDVATEKKKKIKTKRTNVSGYIVFAAEYRKEITAANSDMSFGEISKLVGAKWKALDQEIKTKFEDRARVMAAEQQAKQAEADRAFNDSLNQFPVSQSPGGENGMSPGPSKGLYPAPPVRATPLNLFSQHLGQHGQHAPLQQNTMNGLAFNNTPNPINTDAAVGTRMPLRMVLNQPMRRFRHSSLPLWHPLRIGGPNMAPPPPPRPPSPMFVSVPPKTQRLVHSEAYLRYIENLNSDSQTVGNWDRSLHATQENTPLPSNGKLPVQWLANGVGHHDNAANALWALRDLMMKDAMTISRTLEFSQL